MKSGVNVGCGRCQVSALQLVEKVDIRTATPEDVSGIFALATSLFGSKQFLYTIYQAPPAQAYLEKRVAAGSATNPFFVLEAYGQLVGYYEALVGEKNCFLNYIGIDKSFGGQGYGDLLLAHFTGLARDRGITELALDVFESNELALTWYQRRGFEQKAVRYLTRLDIGGPAFRNPAKAFLDAAELRAALDDEVASGFSKVVCDVGNHSILLGLIGGHSCKLLDWSGLPVETAVKVSAALMRGSRQVLIVSSPQQLSSKLPVLSAESALRMHKILD